MRYLEKLLALGHDGALPERLARHVRIANAIALLGAALATASLPFDVVTGPPWFLAWDIFALAGFAGCLLLNARGRFTVSRIVMLVVANLVFAFSTLVLGEASRQGTVFFTLATVPFFLFDLDELHLLIPLVALPIASYFVCNQIGPIGMRPYSIAAYRVYSPVLAFAGLIIGSFATARTHQRAEQAIRDARARAVASARLAALGEMASGIAHEIRNPLAAISIASEQLADCKHIEDVPKLATHCKRITARITKIVEGLSSFARDATADPFVTAGIGQIVGDTLELCQRRFAAHEVDLSVPAVTPSLVLECRPVQIEQVLVNLLNNAYDAVQSAAERWVRLEIESTADRLEISVTDSGRGIPGELRRQIFEPFFTTKGPGRGTGLGLSVSRGLAEAHQGTLELDEHAAHTRFVLRLPLHQRAG